MMWLPIVRFWHPTAQANYVGVSLDLSVHKLSMPFNLWIYSGLLNCNFELLNLFGGMACPYRVVRFQS